MCAYRAEDLFWVRIMDGTHRPSFARLAILIAVAGTALLAATSPLAAQFGLNQPINIKGIYPVIAGRNASLSDWPAIGSLRYTKVTPPTSMSGYVCGGTIIAPTWFLTAAHCVVRNADETTPSGTFLDDQGRSIDGEMEVVLGLADLRSATAASVYAIEAFVVHPDFMRAYKEARANGFDANAAAEQAVIVAGHDIALVQLKRPWTGALGALWSQAGTSDPMRSLFSKPEPSAGADAPNAQVMVMGFGVLSAKSSAQHGRRYMLRSAGSGADATGASGVIFAGSARLNKTTVPIVDSSACGKRYAGRYPAMALANDRICAGGGKSDSCQGDSGSPLLVTQPDANVRRNGHRYQVGIVSWGHGCAERGWPGIYTSIAAHVSWLETTVGRLNLAGLPVGRRSRGGR